MADIKNSGEMREFETGAHRDSNTGIQKGRPDILPLDVVAKVLDNKAIDEIWQFVRTQDTQHVINAIRIIGEAEPDWKNSTALAMWDTSFHYEDGGKKYDFGNWTYGMPIQVFLDSGLRHYLKHLGGEKDEPHHRATLWNFMNLVWTWEHVPNAKKEFAEYVAKVWHN